MGWAASGALLTLFLLVFIASGMPVAFAMGMTVVCGTLIFLDPSALIIIPTIAFDRSSDHLFAVIPLFVFLAAVVSHAGITERAFGAGMRWFNWLPGNLAVSSLLASTGFAAVSGSSPATAASVGYFAVPEMLRHGYQRAFSLGAVAAGGTLGILIPPSVAMIIYGLITETSIGQLFIAGIVPGLLMAFALTCFVVVKAKRNPEVAPPAKQETSWPDRWRSLGGLWMPVVLFVAVIGSIYLGIATPTEAAAIGATAALVLAFGGRGLDLRKFFESLVAAVETTSMVLLLVIGGFGLSYLFARLGIGHGLSALIIDIGISRWVVLGAFCVLLLVLGTIMDPASTIVVTMPLLFETLMELGFDPIWLGVVVAVTIEIGMITPPVGMNLLVLRTVLPGEVSMGELVRGSAPYVAVMLVGLAILILLPQLSTWLPRFMLQ